MQFSVSQLFELNTCNFGDKESLSKWKKEHFKKVEEEEKSLTNAVGIYVFCITHGANISPWYVGKTSSATGYKTEMFTPHKLGFLSELFTKNGTTGMVLLPLRTNNGRLSKNTSGSKRTIEWVEKRLIAKALTKNRNLLNTKDTSDELNVYLPGVLGTQRRGPLNEEGRLARQIFSN